MVNYRLGIKMSKVTFNYNREDMEVEVGKTKKIINELISKYFDL